MKSKFLLRLKSVLLLPMLFLLLMATSMVGTAQEIARVWTDMNDSAPGETVQIYGSGFLAGETVTISIVHIDPNFILHPHDDFEVVVDDDNTFQTTWLVDEAELNTTLYLSADGQTSLKNAWTTFTDADPNGPVTVTAPLCAQGGSFTISYTGSTGNVTTETKTTPSTFTVKKKTDYSITNIATPVIGNVYTGSSTVTGSTPISNDFTEIIVNLAYNDNTAPVIIAIGTTFLMVQ
jgi:hypothetical protein